MEIGKVRQVIRDATPVSYNSVSYTVTAITMRIRDANWYYQLELMDRNNNSIMIVNINDV